MRKRIGRAPSDDSDAPVREKRDEMTITIRREEAVSSLGRQDAA